MKMIKCAKVKTLKGYKVMPSERKFWGVRDEGVSLRWKRLKKKQGLEKGYGYFS